MPGQFASEYGISGLQWPTIPPPPPSPPPLQLVTCQANILEQDMARGEQDTLKFREKTYARGRARIGVFSSLKRQCHEIFCFWFFSWISFPQAPEYTIKAVSNFFENLRRYLQHEVDHRYQRHRWQICHRCQRHRRQILPPVSLVLLIPVANNGINIRLQIP